MYVLKNYYTDNATVGVIYKIFSVVSVNFCVNFCVLFFVVFCVIFSVFFRVIFGVIYFRIQHNFIISQLSSVQKRI